MGYKRYVSEKSAKARRQESYKKKAKKNVKPATLKGDDEVLVPHPTSPRAFTVKKK